MRLNAIVAALTILLFSPAVLALSLGEAKTQSHLNQPLKASIIVRAVKYDERDTIRAMIPAADKFKRAGMRRDAIVDDISIDVLDGNAEDELVIHLRTNKRIQEPFLSFLVEVRWLGGSVIREYTLLLDPAPIAQARQAQAAPTPAAAAPQERPLLEPREAPSSTEVSAAPRSHEPVARAPRSYGPIKRQETLWSVAFSQRTDPGISMDQMQLAIYQANPQAFDGNINQLRSGSVLTIPSNNEIRAIDPDYAKREVTRQKRRYQPPAAVAARSKPEPVYEAAPEPVEPEVVAQPEPEPEPVADSEAEAATEVEPIGPDMAEADESAAITDVAEDVAAAEPEATSPDMAAASPTADGEARTQDELVDEGDAPGDTDGNIEMPSVWVDEEEAETAGDDATDTAVEAETDAEPMVAEAPEETGGSLGIDSVLSPVTLALALVLLLVLLVTYWWYRKRKVTNVGSQFAYAAEDDADEDKAEAKPDESAKGSAEEPAPDSVWSDAGGVPDSIDEYTASTPGADDLDLSNLDTAQPSEPAVESPPEIDIEVDDTSPIREMSSEEIDYLGEADVHLAYGLYDEAASVLQRGINDNPSRSDLRLKLLDVYHSGSMSDEFVAAAQAWQQAGINNEADWEKAVVMGREIAPDSELFGDGAISEAQPAAAEPVPAAAEPEVADADDNASMDFDADSLASLGEATEEPPAQEVTEEAATANKGDDLEFDLSGFDLDSPTATTAEAAAQDDVVPMDMPEAEADELDLSSIDLGDDAESIEESPVEPEATPAEEAPQEEGALDFDLSELSLGDDAGEAAEGPEDPAFEADVTADNGLAGINPADSLESATEDAGADEPVLLDDEVTASAEPDLDQFAAMADDDITADITADDSAPSESAADEEEISVKLDLARAYLDMGEPEMARTLLDEVVEMGNAQQQQEAKDLIARAG